MKKRVAIFLLTLLLILAFGLTGCNGNTGESKGGTGSKAPGKDEVFDLDGMKIRIASWWDPIPPDGTANEARQMEYDRMKALEKKYNCTFVGVVNGQGELNSMLDAAIMADEIFAEIIFMNNTDAKTRMMQNILLPVSDYFDLDDPMFNQSVNSMFRDSVSNKVYAFSTFEDVIESTIVFNKTIFDRFGLENPYDLVKNNQWTPEKFSELATKATRDGVSGFYGVTQNEALVMWIEALGGSIIKTVDGKYVSGLKDPKTLEALEFLYKMNNVTKNVYMPDPEASWDDTNKQFIAGKVAMASNSVNALASIKPNMTDQYGLLPYPKRADAADYINMASVHNVRVMQPNLDKELARKIAIVYQQMIAPLTDDKEENDRITRSGYEEICWDNESVDLCMELLRKPTKLFEHISAASSVWFEDMNPALANALRGENTIAAAVAAINDKYQTVLDETNATMAK